MKPWTIAIAAVLALQAVGAQQPVASGFSRTVSQRGQPLTRPTAIDPDDIGGVVTSQNGTEAGVLVTAWTDELPTPFSRTVVTDADGRYVVPDVPTAYYKITVSGDGVLPGRALDAWAGMQLFATILVDDRREARMERVPVADRGVVATAWDWGRSDTAIDTLWYVADDKVHGRERVFGTARLKPGTTRNQPGADRVYWLDPQTSTVGDAGVGETLAPSGGGSATTWLAALSRPIPFFTPYPTVIAETGSVSRRKRGESWKNDGAWISLVPAAGKDPLPAGTRSKVVLVQRRPTALAR